MDDGALVMGLTLWVLHLAWRLEQYKKVKRRQIPAGLALELIDEKRKVLQKRLKNCRYRTGRAQLEERLLKLQEEENQILSNEYYDELEEREDLMGK